MLSTVAFFHHPSEKNPFEGADYDAWARHLIKNAGECGHAVLHMCLDGGPDYGCERITKKGNPDHIAYERLLLQRDVAKSNKDVWFLDTDCVLTGSLPTLKADLAFTYRKGFYDCYNGGVMYSGSKGAAILQEIIDIYPKKFDPPPAFPSPHPKSWGGAQRAFRNYMGHRKPGSYQHKKRYIDVLDCDEWNYTPKPGENPSGKRILHFKGELKNMVNFK